MRITGISSIVGKGIIESAVGKFEKVKGDLEDGIFHCNVDIKKHQEIIDDSVSKIAYLNISINKAEKFKEKINALLE